MTSRFPLPWGALRRRPTGLRSAACPLERWNSSGSNEEEKKKKKGTHDRLSRALAMPQCLLRVRWAHILVGVQVDDGLRSRWSTSDAEPASVDAKNCRTFGFVVEARHRRVRRRRGASACDFPGLDLTPPGPASSRVAGGRRVPRAEAVCVLTPRGPCARPEPAAACSRPASARGQRRRFFVVPSVGVRAELPCS